MHNDSMVVKMEIASFLVWKVQIDLGSSADTLYWSAFKQQDIPESQIELFSEQLISFSSETIETMGHVNLLDTFGDDKDSKTIMIRYLLANAFTYYNILIGRPTLNELGVIISTPHLAMKYPSTSGKIIIARADQAMT